MTASTNSCSASAALANACPTRPPGGFSEKIWDLVLVGGFLVAVYLPLCCLSPWQADEAIEQAEQRRAATFPQVEWVYRGPLPCPGTRSLLGFPVQFETWFNDHVGFRPWLVDAYKLARWHGLTTAGLDVLGRKESAGVIRGLDGWLFIGGKDQIDDYRCARPFTAEELDRWVRVLAARRRWLARRGIEYVLFVAPNPATIYPEYLPRAYDRVGNASRLDQLLAHVKQTACVEMLDVRGPLLEAKASHRLYQKTDTHWNDVGAWVAYHTLMSHLAKRWPGAAPFELADFDLTEVRAQGGDLARTLDSSDRIRDDWPTLSRRRPSRATVQVLDETQGVSFDRIATSPSAPLGGAVIWHDSFMKRLMPWLDEHWQRVRYLRVADFPADVITQERPQIVVHEIGERRLMAEIPDNPSDVWAEEQAEMMATVRDDGEVR